MKMLDGCAFCLSNRDQANVPLEKRVDSDGIIPVVDRIIQETDNYIVFETLGQITEGHSLIAPREHYPCIGALPESLFDELIELKQELGMRITKTYSKPIYFEHGVIGQTESHAHLQIIPINEASDTSMQIYRQFMRDFGKVKQIHSLKELKGVWKNEGVYLYYETTSGQQFVYHTPIFPMYGRFVISAALNVPQRGNWKTIPRDQDNQIIKNAVQKLKKS